MLKRQAIITVGCGALLLSTGSLWAQSSCGAQEPREIKPGVLTERTYKRMEDLYVMIGEEQYQEAFAGLSTLAERVRNNEYESAVVAQALGHVRAAQDDLRGAIKFFRQAFDMNALPDATHYDILFNIAQLYISMGEHEAGLRSLDEWFCVTPPPHKEEAYVLKATANAQLNNYPAALEAISTAIDVSDNPRESWYQLKLASHYELKQFQAAADTLETLIKKWPEKKDYWSQLSSVYLTLKEDPRALATLALAHRRGMLEKQQDWMQLYQLYGYMDVPYKAAEILQEGLKRGIVEPTKNHYEQLGSAWFAAQEMRKSAEAYGQAGELAIDGKMDMQQAFIYVELEDWEKAIGALNRALQKGGLDNTGNAYVLKGMAEFEQCNLAEAEASFRSALDFDTVRQGARQWINHLGETNKCTRAQVASS